MIFESHYPDIHIPTNQTLYEFVYRNASKNANKLALVDGFTGRSYTFAQLDQLVRKFATGLSQMGMKKGDVLCVYSPNCIEYPILLHGTTLIGGIVSPANPAYTIEELTFQLNNSGSKYLVSAPGCLEKAKEAAKNANVTKVFVLAETSNDPAVLPFTTLLNNNGQPPKVEINPTKDIAFIPYSSGTSGLAKGCLLTHFNAIANVSQILTIEDYFQPDDAFVGVLPFYHIYALSVILNAGISLGNKIVVMSHFDLVKFLEIIQNYKITCAHIVPPIVLALVKHPIVDKYDLSSLKVIFSGAAPLGPELEKALAQRPPLKHVIIKQGYGMTEMSPVSHINPLDKVKPGSIGVLVPNCKAKIVDVETGNLLTVNREGELRVKGPNVMQGYYNNPEANSETFDDDGFLRTGDIAMVDEDGYYYIMDRLKELIKYKGFQVPPAELEALLVTHPQIADACVVGVPDADNVGELPKAFVVLKPSAKVTERDIIDFVEQRVAPHKRLRGGVEFIDAIPKSAAGKILRRVLREKANATAKKQSLLSKM